MWRCAQPCVLLATALAAVAFIGSASSAAAADQANPLPDPAGPLPETAETRAADAIFQQLLQDPKNVDLTFRYAEAAVKSGNIEAGISSLERLLLLDRNFPGVKLELAELYSRLHSYDMAKSYLDQAAEEPGVDPKALARIQAVRDEIEEATSPSKFATNILIGVRHQSNASAEPAGSDIIAGGVPQTLSTIYLNKPAWDTFATGNVQHVYDFGEIKLESNFLAYYSKSLGHSSLDLGAVEVNSGPRFDFDIADVHLVSARAYALANEVTLGDNQFLHSVGTGLSFDRGITDKLSGAGFYEFRAEWFSPVTLSPAANQMNANVHSFGTALSYHVVENGDLGLQVSYALTDDFAGIGSNKGLVFHLGYSQLFELPQKLGVGPLNISPVAYRIYSRDNGPDPEVDPNTIPTTNEWRFGATAKLGLTNNIAANLSVIHQIATSNVEANRTRNTQVILSAIFAY
jgi:tetratricopeptide (TPR) repeat protein